jgi:hypothetical protein
MNPIPPTTPPAIAPALDFESLADVELAKGLANVGFANAALDGVNELEILVVLVVTADEVVEVLLASDDQEFRFLIIANQNLLHLLSTAAAMLKVLFVYEGKIILIFSMVYYLIHLPG